MNFLNQAANSLGGFAHNMASDPNTMFGRMAQSFGIAHPQIQTPQGLQDPDMLAKGLGKSGYSVGADPTASPQTAQATSQQEAMARNNGFRNYDQMMAWAKQRNTQQGGTIPQQGTGGGGNPDGGPSIGGAQPFAMYPRNMFNYILHRWQGATGGQ